MKEFDLTRELLPGLPAYSGGRMSDTVYNAGEGLRGWFYDGKKLELDWIWDEEDLHAYFERLPYYGFTPSMPYKGEARADITFSNGETAFHITRDGSKLTVEQTLRARGERDEACIMRTVTNTDAKRFSAYVGALERLGFETIWQNRIEANKYIELRRNERAVYAYFTANTGTARFIDERVSASMRDFGGGKAPGGGTLEICQFGLYYGYMRPCVSANCGMLYIIKLPDDTVFIIDGGAMEQATDAACVEIMRLAREMCKLKEGEKLRIAAWYCTHAHEDHMDLFGKLIRFYHDDIELTRVIFNFPANEYYPLMPQTYILLERINKYFPNVKYLKPHAGQRFELAGAAFEVLLTHEDNTGEAGNEVMGGFNDTSSILKMSFDGASVIFTGDMDASEESALLAHFTSQTLKCTAVQAAHHLINNAERAYASMSPKYALVPQHIRRAIPANEKFMALTRIVPFGNQYYASCATDVFTIQGGDIIIKERYPIAGGVYDRSQV